ncbi:MAG: hypothetical protein AB3N14_15990, partial [Flavobacteriaceae bacterium]
MKKTIFTLFFLGVFVSSAQAQLNEYKYIIVPKKFEDFKRENQYLTSTLVKHLFVERGFNAVYEDALPDELFNDRCLGLIAEIKDESSMFVTKASLVLRDCKTQEVFSTQQGSSKEKDFKISYGEALREAFRSFDGIDYSYTPKSVNTTTEPVTVSFKNDVKQLEENKPEAESVTEKVENVAEETMTAEVKKEAVVEQQATPEEQSYKNKTPEPSDIKKAAPPPAVETTEEPVMEVEMSDVLYAQPIANGFQLVDSSARV